MRHPPARFAAAAAALVALGVAGCASPRDAAFFVTKTSTSIVDADAAPASFSLGYDRIEGYAGPRFADGSVYPVASAIETGGSGLDREIRQVFVAGKAALIATARTAPSQAPRAQVRTARAAAAGGAGPTPDDDRRVMLFGTGTTFGIKIGFAEGSPLPNAFTLGYRRKEAAVIPVAQGSLHTSALGSLSNKTGVTPAAAGRAATGFDLQQFFATGQAAENLAALGSIRARFQDSAEQAIGRVEAYRHEEATQGRLALDAAACVLRVGDDTLDRLWNNAEDLQLFTPINLVPRLRAAAPDRARQRVIYAEGLATGLDPARPEVTAALRHHRDLVCRLAR